MSGGHRDREAENRQGLILGAITCLAIAIVIYPPLVFGVAIGFALGTQVAHTKRSDNLGQVPQDRLLRTALLLIAAVAFCELAGITGQREQFLAAWRGGGLFDLDPSALVRYPVAWIVPTAAVAALVAAFVARHRGSA
jgi:hypothetical protein